MDLLSLKPVETVTINLRHPVTSENLGLSLEVCGRDSKKFAQARHKMQSAREERLAVINRSPLMVGPPVTRLPHEYQEEMSLDLMLDCVIGWSGEWVVDKQKLDFSRDNLCAVLKMCPWMREQVDAAISDRANFLPPQPGA